MTASLKTKIGLLFLVQLLAGLAPQSVRAQGTAFTYQGRLNTTNGVANGRYDFTFAVFDTGSGGVSGSGTITNVAVAVSNGLFTTTLDFGSAPEGAPAWLEIGVATNGTAAFTTLSPRQAVLPTPYAMFATTASNLVGTLPLAQLPASVVTNGAVGVNLSGTFTGNGANVTNVNAATLGGLGAGNFWQLGGNTVSGGQFLGSTNNQPLELRVNNQRGLRLEADGANSVNVIGGWEQNAVAAGVFSATIGGGGGNYFGTDLTNRVDASFGTVAGGGGNAIRPFSYQAVIGGGYNNMIQNIATTATIGGGSQNTIQTYASSATISGGGNNVIQTNANSANIGGGEQNIIQSDAHHATIGGGYVNVIRANDSYSSIGGGYGNEILPSSESTTIGGGRGNVISSNTTKATISGGFLNVIQSAAIASTIAGGDYNVIGAGSQSATIAGGNENLASGGGATVGGGWSNKSTNANSTVAGGYLNVAGGQEATVGGGSQNQSAGTYSTVAGGAFNLAGGYIVTVGGGIRNSASGEGTTVGGGGQNSVGGLYATVAGGLSNRMASGSHYSLIGGGLNNSMRGHFPLGGVSSPIGSSIVGGENNVIQGWSNFEDNRPAVYSTLAGGLNNRVGDAYCFLGGGESNLIGILGSHGAFLGGGAANYVIGNFSFLGGGTANRVQADGCFLGGGVANIISNFYAVVGGGFHNTNGGSYATIPGGALNCANGDYSLAAGRRAKALDNGTFVWADSQDSDFASTANNQFLIRATNGVGINKNNPASALDVNGTITCIALNQTSDRQAKENFAAVSAQEILAKVAALPITRWNFKQEAGTPHIGPMAQDFHAAFGLGTDDRHIATVDADGVALAAIQGLHEKLEAQTAAARRKDAEIAELKTRLEKLEQMMNLKAGAAR